MTNTELLKARAKAILKLVGIDNPTEHQIAVYILLNRVTEAAE